MTRTARRGPWLPDEDSTLIQLVRSQGPNNWVRISQYMQHRSPKQCRERYHQNLKPSLNHEPISSQEGEQIEQLVHEMGKRWAEIARRLGNRSDNAVKNWWNGSVNRRKRIVGVERTKHIGHRDQPIHVAANMSRPLRTSEPKLPSYQRSNSNQDFHTHVYQSGQRLNTVKSPRELPHPQPLILAPTSRNYSRELPNSYDFKPVIKLPGMNSVIERPTISPTTSESSYGQLSLTANKPPSLISDSLSSYSISPKTIASPRPSLLAPVDTIQSWNYSPQQQHPHPHHLSPIGGSSGMNMPNGNSIRPPMTLLDTSNCSRDYRHVQFHSPTSRCSTASSNNSSRDTRMNVSRLLA